MNINEPNLLAYKKFSYDQLALKTFQIGLLEPYRGYLSNFDLTSIEECLNKCHFYDNRRQEWEYCEFLRKSQENNKKTSRPDQPSQNANRTFSNPPHFQNRNYNNQTPRSSHQLPQHTSFNKTAQLSSQPRPFQGPINEPLAHTSKFFTNRQVFGSNVKPNSPTSNFQKPTPMSIQSRVRTQQVSSQNNYIQNKSPHANQGIFNIESFNDELDESENCYTPISDDPQEEYNTDNPDFHELASEECPDH